MPRRNYYRAVIFNLDGVILDTERILCDAWKRAGGGLGYPMSEPLVRTLIGMKRADAEQMLVKIFDRRFSFPLVYQRMVVLAGAYIENWGVEVQPGVHAVLNSLDRLQTPRAVISTASEKIANTLLQNTSLQSRFDAILSAENVPASEPLTSLYAAAAEQLNVPADRCLAFESCDSGVRAAHAAGATVILVPHLQPLLPFILPYVYQVEPSLEDVVDELPSLLAVAQPGNRRAKKEIQSKHVHLLNGAKSEPETSRDAKNSADRVAETAKQSSPGNAGKAIEPQQGCKAKVLPPEIVEWSSTVTAPLRIGDDSSASAYRRMDPDTTHPYQMKDLVELVNKRLKSGRQVSSHDILKIRHAHGIDTKPHFFYHSKFASPQYSDAFVDWLVDNIDKDSGFIEQARLSTGHSNLPHH